ncbi:AAA family ATPase [Methylobacterium nodulans]|uniref:Adenylate/guanylate cyclase n=1 Tax=Methylobacterium nodulans (strain LMG 21967 / CNCM I-2342 / ORS 2060) TaxID=460265 RepID=B8IDA2_METNO|nr:adenylate/guanylate cyclase domain-containing protein [Methylobacterium nodulans]ACL61268.1 adenylate/guanylate cyclase [Methylobacterium nodulans ORS 2060]
MAILDHTGRRDPPHPDRLAENPAPSAPERRQLTVMFCDLVDSTVLASRLDPEDLRDVLRSYQGLCAEVVARHGGFVAQFQGDGIVIYFGFPMAHEDSVEAAVRAGLEILRRVPELRVSTETDAQVRIGVATGVVVVEDATETPGTRTAIIGQVPNLAARIQAAAAPGTLVIADASRRLLGSLFDLTDLGPHRLKGIADEVVLWRVDGAREHAARSEGRRSGAVHVGRLRELEALSESWALAESGQGQVVLVRGEPGIGKSALLRAWTSRLGDAPAGALAGPDVTRVALQCSPRHTHSPWYPLLAHLRRVSGLAPDDPPALRREKIERLLAPERRDEGVPLLAHLLSVPLEDAPPDPDLTSDQRKAATLRLLLDELIGLTARRPVVMVVEDAQWADPTTEELARLVIDRLAGRRLLLLVTARPEYQPAWADRPAVRQLTLTGLDAGEAEELVRGLAQSRPLAAQERRDIVAKADGVPLFIEELTHAVLEVRDGPGSGPEVSRVPSTLQDIIMARLDRLGSAKPIAQIGAALGRSFTWTMLQRIAERPDRDLAAALGEIVQAGLLSEQSGAAGTTYLFKHALVQDAAYESLLRASRRTLHARIAAVLEADFPDIAETEPETVAHHLRGAQLFHRAAAASLRAGQRAAARFANPEAIQHFRAGIEDLARVRGEETGLLGPRLHLGLAQAFYVVKGPAHDDTVAAYARAQEFLDDLSDPDERFSLLWGIFSGHHFAARFAPAEASARKCLDLARRDGDSTHLCQAHRMLGYVCFFRGDLPGAQAHFREIRRLYRPDPHRGLAPIFGADCQVGAAGFECVILCAEGRVVEAVAMAEANLYHARLLGHPASIGWALASACYVHHYRGDRPATRAAAAEGVAFCRAHAIAAWGLHCKVFLAWSAAAGPERADLAAEIVGDIADAATRTRLGLPQLRGLAAEALLLCGDPEPALDQVRIALDEIAQTGQAFFGPALLRLRGLCALARGETDAEAWLRKAVAAARAMGAGLLEERARADLAALAQQAGRRTRRELVRALLAAPDPAGPPRRP